MIWLDVEDGAGEGSLSEHMMARGMIVSEPSGPTRSTRLVTPLDFETGDIDKVVDGFAGWLGEVH